MTINNMGRREFVLLPLQYHSSNPGLELKAGSWGQEITEAVGGEI